MDGKLDGFAENECRILLIRVTKRVRKEGMDRNEYIRRCPRPSATFRYLDLVFCCSQSTSGSCFNDYFACVNWYNSVSLHDFPCAEMTYRFHCYIRPSALVN